MKYFCHFRFSQIDDAYKQLQVKFAQDRLGELAMEGEYGLYYQEKRDNVQEDGPEFDIQHTAPQHRQYLSNEGMGYGTPSQRARQYDKYRVVRASEAVHQHRVGSIVREEAVDSVTVRDKRTIRRQKISQHMDRVVEDLIQVFFTMKTFG